MRVLDKRIPTLLAVIFLVIGVVVTSVLVQERIIVFQNAAPSDVPQNVRITNISDSAFTLTYTTDAQVIGTIALSSDKGQSQVVLDERDEQSGVPKPYYVHSITSKNLSANSSYSFKILSGATTYLQGSQPFSITTPAQVTSQPSEQVPLAGKILLPDGTKPTEALILVTTDNGQFLSALLNAAGLYILPLNTMRTKDLSAPIQFTAQTKLQILALNQTLVSHVTTGIININPVPPITLSQDYDFTLGTTPLATGSATTSFPILNFTNATLQATPEIIVPKNNESFTDQQPQFQGTTSPNSSVTISIHSDTALTTQITADTNGNWTYRPTTPLSPGPHTITITTPDRYGILHTLTQNFTVYAAGSQINQPATPSATLVPLPTSGQATPTPTVIPTVILQATATPTPTLMPTAMLSTKPTRQPTLPPTGSNTIAVAGIAGIATTIVGIIVFMITSGTTL